MDPRARQKLTSSAMPGKNIATDNPWKNFRRAFNPSVGICLSAASSRSVATFETPDPFGRLGMGMLDKVGNEPTRELPELLPPESSPAELEALKIAEVGLYKSSVPVWLRSLRRRLLATCLPHPATLMHPRRPQYPRRTGRLHLLRPSVR
jgi:hypothetical protein